MAANGTEELAEELVDYEEEEAAEADAQPAAKPGEQVKKGYVGIHSSGFKARLPVIAGRQPALPRLCSTDEQRPERPARAGLSAEAGAAACDCRLRL